MIRNRKRGLSRRDMQLLRAYWQQELSSKAAHIKWGPDVRVLRTWIDADSMASPEECEQ